MSYRTLSQLMSAPSVPLDVLLYFRPLVFISLESHYVQLISIGEDYAIIDIMSTLCMKLIYTN